jgi:hypothetical protein
VSSKIDGKRSPGPATEKNNRYYLAKVKKVKPEQMMIIRSAKFD